MWQWEQHGLVTQGLQAHDESVTKEAPGAKEGHVGRSPGRNTTGKSMAEAPSAPMAHGQRQKWRNQAGHHSYAQCGTGQMPLPSVLCTLTWCLRRDGKKLATAAPSSGVLLSRLSSYSLRAEAEMLGTWRGWLGKGSKRRNWGCGWADPRRVTLPTQEWKQMSLDSSECAGVARKKVGAGRGL